MNQEINGLMEGCWKHYWSNGSLSCKGSYISGKKDGYWELYHYSGRLDCKGNYINGIQVGYWEYYVTGELETQEILL